MHILVVDRSPASRRRIRTWLIDSGHISTEIIDAQDSQAALDVLGSGEFHVDAIVCEWVTPVSGHDDFIGQFRSVPGFSDLGVIAFGSADPASRASAAGSGADYYLAQPMEPGQLHQALLEIAKAAGIDWVRKSTGTTRIRHAPPGGTPPPPAAPGHAGEAPQAERGLAGELESLPISDVVGILHASRKTGLLRIKTERRTMFLHFVAGSLRHAECDGRVGEEVFYDAAALLHGHFEFVPGPATEKSGSIVKDLPTLLIEGFRRRDRKKTKGPRTRTRV